MVIGFSNLSQNFANFAKWACLLQTKLEEKLEFRLPKPCEFYQVHKLSLVLNLMDISYYNFSLEFYFDF